MSDRCPLGYLFIFRFPKKVAVRSGGMKILKMKELKPLSWGNYKNEKSEKHQKKNFFKALEIGPFE